jgi:hypothetical protein
MATTVVVNFPTAYIYVLKSLLEWTFDFDFNKLIKKNLHGLSLRTNYTTEGLPLVGEVIANFLRIEGATWLSFHIIKKSVR